MKQAIGHGGQEDPYSAAQVAQPVVLAAESPEAEAPVQGVADDAHHHEAEEIDDLPELDVPEDLPGRHRTPRLHPTGFRSRSRAPVLGLGLPHSRQGLSRAGHRPGWPAGGTTTPCPEPEAPTTRSEGPRSCPPPHGEPGGSPGP